MRSAVGISSGGGSFDTAVVRVEVKSEIVLDMIAIGMLKNKSEYAEEW